MPALLRTARRRRRRLHDDTGAAVVEFALLVPVLLLFAMAAIDFGRVVATGIAVSGAVRAGAQYGAQSAAASVDQVGMIAAAKSDFGEGGFGALTVDSARTMCRCTSAGAMGACASVGATCGVTPQAFVAVGAQRTVALILRYPGFPASYAVRRSAVLRVQ
ncbi:TadE/TadG family type IV pilus assembly protein [Roseisolibacter sp. H3M3-2]|uniref:TadE/TadG family type IV pilus assembly protein n=1 Tax=Roseisolibacter sp. H3M3-2 TaxID=3031323 RepID=UPI0023DB5D7E|nr:TadE/TadG family type IV pilus assembly protein [Roseisolibacter sp. H3M3-2]MDF1502326.1 TadE/TadG family type IV pilus assembly protein [Roseisolibacter sp. H3M3-2]